MASDSSILAALGVPETQLSEVTFLAGAGISYPPPARLPTVVSFIEQVVRHCSNGPDAFDAIARFMRSGATTSPRFEVLVEAIGQLGVDMLSIGSLFDSLSPNLLHRYLARQCEAGAVIVTTNFDNCLERAFRADCVRVVFRGGDLDKSGPPASAIVKPHGSNPIDARDQAGELVVSIRALSRTAKGFQFFPVWRSYLRSLFSDRVVVVVGYSGSDDFDITPVLLESRPRALLWLDYAPGAPPHRSDLSVAAESVRYICEKLPSLYMRGDIGIIAAASVDSPPVLVTGHSTVPRIGLDDWLQATFPSDAGRQELLCTLLRHYSLHDLTLSYTSPPLSAEAVLQRGTALYYRGLYRDACSTLESIGAYSPTTIQQCRAAYLLSSSLFYAGNITEAKSASRRNLELAEQLHDIGEVQTALNHAGALSYSAGERDEARALYERVLSYQDQYPSLQAATMATWGIADIANAAGRGSDAINGYSSALVLSHQLGSGQGVAWMSANLGEVLLRACEYTRSGQYLAEAEELFEQLGIAAGVLYARACRAQLDYCTGDALSANARLLRCLPLLAEHLESPAISTVILLCYLLAKDTEDDGLLVKVRQAAAAALREPLKHSRAGEAEMRWVLCAQVLDEVRCDSPELYQRCRALFVVPPEAEGHDAKGEPSA